MSTALSRIRELKENTREAYLRAEAVGDNALMAELEALFEEIKRAEKRVMLNDLAVSAGAIAALADRLEQATREMDRAVDTFFADDLLAVARDLGESAGAIHDALRHERAPEAPGAEGAAVSDSGWPASRGPSIPRKPSDYVSAFETIKLRPEFVEMADVAVDILAHPDSARRYRAVERETGVPWWFVAILHTMETSGNFTRHLHNGDPLNAPTLREPAGRPANWRPGMRWEESAADALTGGDHKLDTFDDWSLGKALERMERWNGLGYRNRGLMSPYLWSGSEYYEKGKFVEDGKFDPEFPSRQVGGGVLSKRLNDRGFLSISDSRKAISSLAPAALGTEDLDAIDFSPFPHAQAEIAFPLAANSAIRIGAGGENVQRVQEWCCLHSIPTTIDGDFGGGTEGSVKRFQNRNSLAATGEVDRETWLLLTLPMRRALAPLEDMTNAAEGLIRVARRHLLQKPAEVGGNNMGPWVRLYMTGQHGENQRWCAGFVCTLFAQAARDIGLKLPWKRQVSVDTLVGDAKRDGRFIAENTLSDPNLRPSIISPGTLFVIRGKPNDWTHVGIVSEALPQKFRTIEGNTNGSNVDGGNARSSEREYSKRDFLRLV